MHILVVLFGCYFLSRIIVRRIIVVFVLDAGEANRWILDLVFPLKDGSDVSRDF